MSGERASGPHVGSLAQGKDLCRAAVAA